MGRDKETQGYLLGELDVVEDDEGTFDIEDGAVVHTGSNVVVAHGGAGVYEGGCHFTRIVCCFCSWWVQSASERGKAKCESV